MDIYQELADAFVSIRREYSYVKFDKEISRKIKNDIFVMSYLRNHGGAAHPKDLSEEFMISTARMAVILNQLEEKGEVVRQPDPDDSRQTIVRLTDKGASFFEKCNGEIVDFIALLFREIGEQDARELIRIVRELMDAVSRRR